MRKRSGSKGKRKKPRTDPNQAAFDVLKRVIGKIDSDTVARRMEDIGPTSDGKNPAAVALGRRGGLKGGRARVDKMTEAELSESGRKAARARWDAHFRKS